jgi:hypothetical protein
MLTFQMTKIINLHKQQEFKSSLIISTIKKTRKSLNSFLRKTVGLI